MRIWMILALSLGCAAKSNTEATSDESTSAPDDSESSESPSTGATPTGECEPPANTPFTASLEPVELPFLDGAPSSFRDASCITTAVDVDALTLDCPDLEWSIEATDLGVDFTALAAIDDGVRLQYYSRLDKHGQNPWAILRRASDDTLLFAVVLGYFQAPFAEALTSVTLANITDTDCATSDGSCYGISRRAAITASIDGGPPTIVYDRNTGDVGDYRIQVGAAVYDEGNCESFSDNRYEVAVYPLSAAR